MKFVVFMVLYVGWSVLFRPDAYQYFCVAVKPFFKKIKGKMNKGKKNKQKE